MDLIYFKISVGELVSHRPGFLDGFVSRSVVLFYFMIWSICRWYSLLLSLVNNQNVLIYALYHPLGNLRLRICCVTITKVTPLIYPAR